MKLSVTVHKTALFCFLVIIGISILPHKAYGVSISLSAPSTVSEGDKFSVTALIDTEGEIINTVEGKFSYDPTLLLPIEFSDSNSISTLWIKRPDIRNPAGLVSFSGLVPGGFGGVIDSFSGTNGPGILFTISFQARHVGTARLTADNLHILLNDGKGTRQKVSPTSHTMSIVSAPLGTSTDSREENNFTGTEDVYPPEITEAVLVHDPLLYNGRLTLVFHGRDTASGISHFEVREGVGSWVVAESPYLVKNTMADSIELKAIDNAGNYDALELPIPQTGLSLYTITLTAAGIGIALFIFGKWILLRRRKQKTVIKFQNHPLSKQ